MLLYLTQGDETKMRIAHAVDGPIEELTVEAICRKSGVSKPTFYRHFESKYDIAVWMSKLMSCATLDEIGRTLTWEEGLASYFEFGIKELFYLSNLRAAPDAYERICEQRERHRYEAITDTLAMHGIEVDSLMSRVIRAYIKVELHFSEERMEPGQSQDVDEIVGLAMSFIPPLLYDALKDPLNPS